MKAIMMIMAALVMVVTLVECEKSAVSRLKYLVYDAQKECPVDIGSGFVAESISYDEEANMVVMECTTSSIELPAEIIDYYTEHPDVLKKIMLAAMIRQGTADSEFVDPIIDADAGITFSYKFAGMDKPLKVALTAEELRQASKSELTSLEASEDILKAQVEMANATQCGIEAEGMRINKVDYDGRNVIYDMTYDESAATVDMFKMMEDDFKQAMLSEPDMNSMIELLAPMGKGIKFQVHGAKSKATIDLLITEEDYRGHPMQ